MKKYNVVILGLGVTGYATAAYCYKQGNTVAVNDDRINPPLLSRLKNDFPDIGLSLGSYDLTILMNADMVVVSPGINPNNPVLLEIMQKGVNIVSDIDLFLAVCKKPVIAITGSNGKSTVVKMMHDILVEDGKKCCMIGNVGTPVLSILADKDSVNQFDYFILEISSFQLFWTKNLHCSLGIVINIFPNHLDWHKNMESYQRVKLSLCNGSKIFILPEILRSLYLDFGYNLEKVNDWIPSSEDFRVEKEVKVLKKIGLEDNFIDNALSAIFISRQLKISEDVIERAIKMFKPWPYRCQLQSGVFGTWYNDSKSTNLAAAEHALKNVCKKHNKKIIWIAGGVAKKESFDDISRWAKNIVKFAIVYGQDRKWFLDSLKGICTVSPVNDLEDAMFLLKKTILEDDVIVFSPAAASFDQYKNYQHRGQCFNEFLYNLFPEVAK